MSAISHEFTVWPSDATIQHPSRSSIVADSPSAVTSIVRPETVTERVSPLPDTSYVRSEMSIVMSSTASSSAWASSRNNGA